MIEAVEILKQKIAAENPDQSQDKAIYKVWSPPITLETAPILQEVLEENHEEHG